MPAHEQLINPWSNIVYDSRWHEEKIAKAIQYYNAKTWEPFVLCPPELIRNKRVDPIR